ncbi:MAG: hypothetical protein PUP92_17060 [Rhizonema sp. PD38]|nr:hypothetical protein [Rhizonema sp. PD38]
MPTMIDQMASAFEKTTCDINYRNIICSEWKKAQIFYEQPCMILYSSKYTKQKIDVAPVDFKDLTTHWIKERVRKQFSENYSNCRKKGWMPLFVTTID